MILKACGLIFFPLLLVLFIGIQSLVAQENIETDSTNFAKGAWNYDTLSPGVIHSYSHFDHQQIFSSNQNIHILKVGKNNQNIKWKIASSGQTLAKTSQLAKDGDAIAGVNASFFNMKKGGSVNFIRIDGAVMDTSVTEKGPGIYGQNQSGAYAFNEKEFIILKRQTPTQGKWEESIPYPNVMECGPILLVNFEKQSLLETPFNNHRHPRTGVCVTDTEILLITVDGRNALAHGMSLPEFTKTMIWLGCKDGLNLDGGGSTTFYIKEKGVVNMPCDNKLWDHEGERPVSNALIITKNQ